MTSPTNKSYHSIDAILDAARSAVTDRSKLKNLKELNQQKRKTLLEIIKHTYSDTPSEFTEQIYIDLTKKEKFTRRRSPWLSFVRMIKNFFLKRISSSDIIKIIHEQRIQNTKGLNRINENTTLPPQTDSLPVNPSKKASEPRQKEIKNSSLLKIDSSSKEELIHKTKLTHFTLIKIMYLLNYPIVCPENEHMEGVNYGICFGFSTAWEQAVCLGPEEEAKFYRRLKLLETCLSTSEVAFMNDENKLVIKDEVYIDKEKLDKLAETIDDVRNKVKMLGLDSLSVKEMDYLEIAAFLDTVYLRQEQSKRSDIFQTKLKQDFISRKFTESKKMEQLGGLQVVSDMEYSFNQQTLENYLENLKKLLENYPNTSIKFNLMYTKSGHAVVMQYDITKEKWKYVDTNDFRAYTQKEYYRLLDTKDLAANIFESHKRIINQSENQSKDRIETEVCISTINKSLTSPSNTIIKTIQTLNSELINKEKSLLDALKHDDLDKFRHVINTFPDLDINKEILYFDKENKLLTLLGVACSRGNMEAVELLLSHKNINVNQLCKGFSPLTVACGINNLPLVKKLLTSQGIDVNIKNLSTNLPAIFMACSSNDFKIVEALIKAGADMEMKDEEGQTPVFYIARNENICAKFLRWLSSNPEYLPLLYAKDSAEKTVMDLAVENKTSFLLPLLHLIVQADMDPKRIMNENTSKQIVPRLKNKTDEKSKVFLKKIQDVS